MQRLDINDLIEINDEKFNPVVLVNEPDMRLVLLCLRAGQQVPEYSVAVAKRETIRQESIPESS